MKFRFIYSILCLVFLMSCEKYEIKKQQSIVPAADTTVLRMYTSQNTILPNNQINVVHSKAGNLWMGTAEGLALRKNNNWTLFNMLNSRLPNNYITALTTDNFNNLWVGTIAGLAIYDGTNWKNMDSVNQKYFLSNTVNDIIYDSRNDLIWVATSNGLLRFDKKTWRLYNSMNSGLMDDYILSLTVDLNGHLMLSTFDQFQFRGRIWKYDFQNWSHTNLDDKGLNSAFPDYLYASKNGKIYFTTRGTTGSAFVEMNGNTWRIFSKYNNENFREEVTDVSDWKDIIIIGKSNGLLKYDGNTVETIELNYPSNYFMYVSDLEVGVDGTIYMGTYNNGLCEIILAQ